MKHTNTSHSDLTHITHFNTYHALLTCPHTSYCTVKGWLLNTKATAGRTHKVKIRVNNGNMCLICSLSPLECHTHV